MQMLDVATSGGQYGDWQMALPRSTTGVSGFARPYVPLAHRLLSLVVPHFKRLPLQFADEFRCLVRSDPARYAYGHSHGSIVKQWSVISSQWSDFMG